MTAVDIQSKADLIAYLNEREFEATIEIADVELEAVCTIRDIDFPFGEVKGITVDLVSLNGIPAKWHSTGIIRLAEEKLSKHEDVLVDVRSTVQYVLDMQDGCRGDWTGGDRFDSIEERERDRRCAMGKHTPGPWKVMPEDGIISGNYRGIVAGKGFLDKKTNTGFNVTALMSEADARLIAAAPEMYEALKDLYVWHTGGCKINESCQCGQCLTCRVRALLARIEGGE